MSHWLACGGCSQATGYEKNTLKGVTGMEQFGKKNYLSLVMEIVKLADDVVTESVSLEWEWSIDENGGFES